MTKSAVLSTYDYLMTRTLKEGKVGNFQLKKRVIEPGTVLPIYHREGMITKAKYEFNYPIITLMEGEHLWMSDTQLEIESLRGAVEFARGDVLIGGLGIGLLPTLIRDKHKVGTIDIIELHQEVTDLVFHQIATPKMSIINDDIFHYLDTTTKRYDFIHIDIWGSITAPMGAMDNARQKAARCLKDGGVTWCWLQELYDRIKGNLPKEPMYPTSKAGIHPPCLICGKTLRNDYAGLCMDCADGMGVSEMFTKRK